MGPIQTSSIVAAILLAAAHSNGCSLKLFLEKEPVAEISTQDSNKAIVQASFDRWKSGSGSPFELLIPDAEWTIVGSSPLSKTYHSRKEFLAEVGGPFDARMAKPPVRTVRGMYADGDMVIILFDIDATGRDGLPYRNAYTWYFQMKDARVVKATAFFDTRVFDEFWTRVSPKP
jgi:ketosteroid isomerase-like protein